MGNYVTVLTLMDFFSKGIFSIVYGEVTGTRLTFLHLKIIELANCFRLLQQATQYIVLKRREIHQVSATSAQLPPWVHFADRGTEMWILCRQQRSRQTESAEMQVGAAEVARICETTTIKEKAKLNREP